MFRAAQRGSGLPPPKPSAVWWCNGCRRTNPGRRFQCTVCKYGNTYDLCAQCVSRAGTLHPRHPFMEVR
ncbi:unnamed protein product [Rotaria sp. Silwood1]|nr:unnamed protein product [Rotaria sp. Silwood1]CAF3722515.1 unnamed protein product [Rotaria sp. Silwood1]CAF4746771.1 unnamed protein product [Rotaria sp. Silwood1]